MFSRRTAWSVAPNRIAAALEDRRRSGRPVLDLTETNPTQFGLRMPEAEIRAALADARGLGTSGRPSDTPRRGQRCRRTTAAPSRWSTSCSRRAPARPTPCCSRGRCSLRRLPRLPEQPLPLHARHAPPRARVGHRRLGSSRRGGPGIRGSFCPSENEPGAVAIQRWCASLVLHPGPDARGQGSRVFQQGSDHPLHPALADADDRRRAGSSKR